MSPGTVMMRQCCCHYCYYCYYCCHYYYYCYYYYYYYNYYYYYFYYYFHHYNYYHYFYYHYYHYYYNCYYCYYYYCYYYYHRYCHCHCYCYYYYCCYCYRYHYHYHYYYYHYCYYFINIVTMEPYLDLVQNYRYRKAISSIRTSSHTLAVEYGRHHNIPLNMRLCHTCCMIDDEMHFIMNCKINQVERDILYSNIMQVDQSFVDLHAKISLFTCFRVEIHRFWPGLVNSFTSPCQHATSHNVDIHKRHYRLTPLMA